MEQEIIHIGGDSVKSDRFGSVSGYLVRFGDPQNVDLSGDFFTKNTDFGFPLSKEMPINLYYQHGMDKTIRTKSVGSGTVIADDIGLWIQAQIDINDGYGKAIASLASKRKLGFSSGAAGHLVSRKQVGDAYEITQWALAEASLTPNPAEPLNMIKSMDDLMSELAMEDEDPMVPAPMESPEQFASSAFSESGSEIAGDAIECLFECLTEGLSGAIESKGAEASDYAFALIDEFSVRSKSVIRSILSDANLIKSYSIDKELSVRVVERRLRDVIGLSRQTAKTFASLINQYKYSNVFDEDQEQSIVVQDENSSNDQERKDIIERLEILDLL